jgi:16S rRNA (uracil1498-N3)-methyltransferase
MSRREFFYAAPAQVAGDEVHLIGDEHEHCSRVLHKAPGDTLTVVDGEGHALDGVIVAVEKQRTRIRITQRRENVGEPRARLTLAQAVPKGNRFDWLIEKGTEIGVSAFIPLRCERSEMPTSEAKRERWQRLALAAMKQSCRSVLPSVESEKSFVEVCAAAGAYDFAVLAQEGATLLQEILTPYRMRPVRGLLLIGPEGGFSETELAKASAAAIPFFSMGPRRLRAETAGLVAATLAFSALGEFEM